MVIWRILWVTLFAAAGVWVLVLHEVAAAGVWVLVLHEAAQYL